MPPIVIACGGGPARPRHGGQSGVCFSDLAEDGRIAAITDFRPTLAEFPASRAHLAGRY